MDLIDLNSLTESERDIILKVIQRNDDLLKDEKFNCRKLESEIKVIRRKGILKSGQDASKSCSRCRCEFGFFFGPKGQACPQCGQMVCEECRILKPIEGDADIQFYRSSEWMCELCFKQKKLKAMNGEWFFTTNDTKPSSVIKSSFKRKPESNNNSEGHTGEISDTQSQSSHTSIYQNSPQILGEVTATSIPSENDQQMLKNLMKSTIDENNSTSNNLISPKPAKPSRTFKQISVRKTVESSDSEEDFTDSKTEFSRKNETIEVIVTNNAITLTTEDSQSPTSNCQSIDSYLSARDICEKSPINTVPVIRILDATLDESIDDLVEANIDSAEDAASFSDTPFYEEGDNDFDITAISNREQRQLDEVDEFPPTFESNVSKSDSPPSDNQSDANRRCEQRLSSCGDVPLETITEVDKETGPLTHGGGGASIALNRRKTLLSGSRFSVEENPSDNSYVDISYRLEDTDNEEEEELSSNHVERSQPIVESSIARDYSGCIIETDDIPSISDELLYYDSKVSLLFEDTFEDRESVDDDALSDISECTEPEDISLGEGYSAVDNSTLTEVELDINDLAQTEMRSLERGRLTLVKQNTLDLLESNDCGEDSEPFCEVYNTNYGVLEKMNSTSIDDGEVLNLRVCTQSPIVAQHPIFIRGCANVDEGKHVNFINSNACDQYLNDNVVEQLSIDTINDKCDQLKHIKVATDSCTLKQESDIKINGEIRLDTNIIIDEIDDNTKEVIDKKEITEYNSEKTINVKTFTEECLSKDDQFVDEEKDENYNLLDENEVDISNTSSLTLLSISRFKKPFMRVIKTQTSMPYLDIPECDRNSDVDSLGSNNNKAVSTCSNESIDTAFSNHSHFDAPMYKTLNIRNTNLLSPFSGSTESMLSVYSMTGEGANYGKFAITGDIYLSMQYDYRKETFEVNIKKCRDLAIADVKRKKTDPYVKLYLLPDRTRNGKRKTSIKKNSSNPTFDETVKFKVNKSELENRALWVSIWHSDSFGRNEFLGETTISSDLLIADESSIPSWYPLQAKSTNNSLLPKVYKGDIDIALRIMKAERTPNKKSKAKGCVTGTRLEVRIIRAKNLTAMKSHGASDAFCKGYLLPNRRRKQKTSVKKRDCNPEWGEKDLFTFELLSDEDELIREELRVRSLELTVWDYDRLTSNDFLGGIRLNLGEGHISGQKIEWMDSYEEEVDIWNRLVNCKSGEWLNATLPLRENMDTKLSLF